MRRRLRASDGLQSHGAGLKKIGLDRGEEMQAFFANRLPRKTGLHDTDFELERCFCQLTFSCWACPHTS